MVTLTSDQKGNFEWPELQVQEQTQMWYNSKSLLFCWFYPTVLRLHQLPKMPHWTLSNIRLCHVNNSKLFKTYLHRQCASANKDSGDTLGPKLSCFASILAKNVRFFFLLVIKTGCPNLPATTTDWHLSLCRHYIKHCKIFVIKVMYLKCAMYSFII